MRIDGLAGLVQRFALRFSERGPRRADLARRIAGAAWRWRHAQLISSLQCAALVLDIGSAIDFYNRFNRTATVISRSDLPGFSHRESAQIAAILLRAERERIPRRFQKTRLLTPGDKHRIGQAAAALLVADELERRLPPGCPVDSVSISGNAVQLPWLRPHGPGRPGQVPGALGSGVQPAHSHPQRVEMNSHQDGQNGASFAMGHRFGEHPFDGEYPGKLIIVEGIDGSGKSTQLDLLGKWLNSLGFVTVFTEWNSSPIVRGTTKRGKDDRMLTPMSFSLIHAADFANRVYTQVLPALKAGIIVLSDRYAYTAFARDASVESTGTGCAGSIHSPSPRRWPSTSRCRWKSPSAGLFPAGEEIGFYESGQDMGFGSSRAGSFRSFQGRLLDEYDSMTEEFGLVAIDATQPISTQQQIVRQHVEPLLPGAMKAHGQNVNEALTASGLTGRYIRSAPRSRPLEPVEAADS